jgi:acyl-CoA synthetase (AMP-forming)/AMP-acid ligase II
MNPSDLAGASVPALLEERARTTPFRVALSVQSVLGFRDRLTYAQLDLYMRRVGAGLSALGAQAGDRVAVHLDNDAGREAVLTALGCFAIGAVVVPVNTRSSDDELRHALALVRPRLLVTVRANSARVHAACPAARLVCIDAVGLCDGTQASSSQWPEPTVVTDGVTPVARADSPSCLLYTSGTTARSKAVVHTHGSMLHAGLAMGKAVGLGDTDLYQGAFPFFTSSCLNIGCMSSWVHGAGFVMEHALGNAQRLRLIESECTTVYHGVPSVIRFMIDEAEQGRYALERVRRIAYGGAAMPSRTIERIAERWPWADQVHVWGIGASSTTRAARRHRANRGSSASGAPAWHWAISRIRWRPRRRFAMAGCSPATSSSRTTMASCASSIARRT